MLYLKLLLNFKESSEDNSLHTKVIKYTKIGVHLGVKTCEVFLYFGAIVFLLFLVLNLLEYFLCFTSLMSRYRFLDRG